MKVSELQGAALDWAVACVEKLPMDLLVWEYGLPVVKRTFLGHTDTLRCEFSTNWAAAGPIIEREGIAIDCERSDWCIEGWIAALIHEDKKYGGIMRTEGNGPTPLIAAMRCYVASKLGDEVEVPEELK